MAIALSTLCPEAAQKDQASGAKSALCCLKDSAFSSVYESELFLSLVP
jgi:hypothetical protein